MVNTGKISPNENGGASVYYSHIRLLHSINYEIELIVNIWSDDDIFDQNDYSEIKNYIKQIHIFESVKEVNKGRLARLKKSVFNPAEFEYVFVNSTNRKHLQHLVNNLKPDLIWCEWRWTAILAANSNLKTPIIYAHHDWEYKLAQLRSKLSGGKKFHNFQKKRVEFDLVKKVTACVTGSKTEAIEIETISKKKALYLPTTYSNIQIVDQQNQIPNIIHLGGMNTTANRLGLERFIDVCWKDVKASIPQAKLIVIGGLNGASDTFLEKLMSDSTIECLGFVKDLDSVMKPGDIHIVPWEYNTGTRTRVPIVLNYGQVLIATKESVKAFPELIHNENAILCDGLKEMTKQLIAIFSKPNTLKEISENGKQTFLNKFTIDSLKVKLQKFIETEVL